MKLLEVRGIDCTGTRGFDENDGKGKCVEAPRDPRHCKAASKVLRFDTRGCQMESDCTTSGYKVESDACVAKVSGDCMGEQGFHAGKCVAVPRDARHCQAVGKVLQFDTRGCQPSGACTTSGYKVESGACVAKVGADCTSEQGFENGKCITATTAKHCTDRGAFILNRAMTGCQTESDCTTSGYRVVSGACVAQMGADDCTGTQGFESGQCITATTGQHCQNRGDFVLNMMADEGCQPSAECTGVGYKVESGACVAQMASDCTGTQGFESGKCITASTTKHCTDRGAFILNKATTGCQTESDCTTSGYKVQSDACVAKVAGDCNRHAGLRVGQVYHGKHDKALHG